MKEKDLPDLPCPRPGCGNSDTIPVRRFGYPLMGKKDGTGLWICLACGRQFDGPKVKR